MSNNSVQKGKKFMPTKGDISEEKGSRMAPKDELLRANNLNYRMPDYVNVVAKRTLVRHFFDKNTYKSNETLVSRLNGGDGFVDAKNSYLKFRVEITASGGRSAKLGSGSGLNFIREVALITETNAEVERLQSVNNLMHTLDYYEHSQDWFDSVGTEIGYHQASEDCKLTFNFTAAADDGGVAADAVKIDVNRNGTDVSVGTSSILARGNIDEPAKNTGESWDFVIPLSEIAGLFRVDTLLPGLGLLSGMRVQISPQSDAVACVWSAGPTAGSDYYEIKDVSIMLDTYSLDTGALRTLTTQSANNGLEVWFNSWDNCPASCADKACTGIDAKRAVTRANYAVAKTRITANTTSGTADSFLAESSGTASLIADYQFNLAGLYLPNQQLNNDYEFYQNALYTFDKVSGRSSPCAVSVKAFITKNAVMCALLERSNALQLSGLPLSGSRILRLDVNYTTAVSRTIDLYVNFMKVLKIYLDKVIVKE